jgi:hypothetical protein
MQPSCNFYKNRLFVRDSLVLNRLYFAESKCISAKKSKKIWTIMQKNLYLTIF